METTSKDKLSVVIGTYHCSVAQFDFDLEVGSCQRRWVDDSATKSISAITFNGFFTMFGGNDELVRIINVASNQNVGALYEHQGSITHLETFQNTHLLSSSDDGKTYIWEIGGSNKNKVKHKKNMAKSWECLCCMHNLYKLNNKNRNDDGSNEWNKFNSKILSFSIHPSGRLMISIDNKHDMKIWDLIRAKCIVTIKMPKPAIDIKWSPNGYTYCIVRENKVLIYHKEGVLYKVIKPNTKMIDNEFPDRYQGTIVSFTYITHDMIAIADMSARIVVYDIDTKTALFRLSGHEPDHNDDDDDIDNTENSKPRIRNLKVCSLNDNLYVISADNRGRICIWNVHECLNRVITINSDNFNDLDGDHGDNEDDQDIDIQIESNLNKQQNNENNDDNKDENEFLNEDDDDDDDDDDINDSDEEGEDDDFMIDGDGLFTFPALMQVDTDTHITCMDVGVVGRLNMLYKWKKPKINDIGEEVEIETETENNSGKKRKFDEMIDDEMIDEENETIMKQQEDEEDIIDSDDEKLKQMQQKKKRKKKKKKKKAKIDLSRFD